MSAFQELFDLIGELARRRYQIAERSLATIGLNHTEARLLTLLRKEGGVAAQDVLSDRMFVDRTNSGRALQRLEREGYILRHKDEADKRANHIRITEKGRNAAIAISRMKKPIAENFFGDLREHQAEEVLHLLRNIPVNS